MNKPIFKTMSVLFVKPVTQDARFVLMKDKLLVYLVLQIIIC